MNNETAFYDIFNDQIIVCNESPFFVKLFVNDGEPSAIFWNVDLKNSNILQDENFLPLGEL